MRKRLIAVACVLLAATACTPRPGPTPPFPAPTTATTTGYAKPARPVTTALPSRELLMERSSVGRGIPQFLVTSQADLDAVAALPDDGATRLAELLRPLAAVEAPTPQRPWLVASIHWGINCVGPGAVERDEHFRRLRMVERREKCQGGGAETRLHVVSFTPDDGPLPFTATVAARDGFSATPARPWLVAFTSETLRCPVKTERVVTAPAQGPVRLEFETQYCTGVGNKRGHVVVRAVDAAGLTLPRAFSTLA